MTCGRRGRRPIRGGRFGAALLEHARAVSLAVVGHHPGDVDAEVAEVGDGSAEEDGDGGAGLVRIDLGEADAGVVVEADVHVVPASPGRALAAVPCDAVAGLVEAREFLDVQVQQLTGMLSLVAADRRSRFEGVEPVEPCPAQDPVDGGGRDPTVRAIWIPGWRWSRNAAMRATVRTGVARDCRCGRELRSARPSRPST